MTQSAMSSAVVSGSTPLYTAFAFSVSPLKRMMENSVLDQTRVDGRGCGSGGRGRSSRSAYVNRARRTSTFTYVAPFS